MGSSVDTKASPDLDRLREVFKGISRALEAEKRAASIKKATLGQGTRIRIAATGSVYCFATYAPVDASSGDQVIVEIEGRDVEGVITQAGAHHVEIALDEDAGAGIPGGATLRLDTPWLLERLRQRVREVFDAGVNLPTLSNLELGLLSLGVGEIVVDEKAPEPQYENARRPLNEAQTRGVEVAFRAPLSVVAAPAGTGKTVLLGAVVEACHRLGWRVLIAAQSNAAVDLLMLQACERLCDEPGFGKAEVLRIGADVGPELRENYGDAVMQERVVCRLRPDLETQIAALRARADGLAARLDAAHRVPRATSGHGIDALRHELTVCRAEIADVQKEMRRVGRALAAAAHVVGATLARVYLDDTLGRYDVVIVDEGSMALPPAVFVAASLARRHVVVAGDPYQLMTPVLSHGLHSHWLAKDVFQRLDVVSAIRNEEDVPYLTVLTEQRRCAEDICALHRAIWYGPSLTTAREVYRRERARPNVIFGTASLCYIDTALLDPVAYHPWGGTFANDVHASLIERIVAYIESSGELPPAGMASGEVLAMSHYRGQVAAISRLLKPYRDRGVICRTVHRAQGSEATSAIFDLTLAGSNVRRSSSILTATDLEDEGSRLLVTAMSRGRSRLIVVGDMQWLKRHMNPQSVIARVYAHLRENGYEIKLSEVLSTSARPSLRLLA